MNPATQSPIIVAKTIAQPTIRTKIVSSMRHALYNVYVPSTSQVACVFRVGLLGRVQQPELKLNSFWKGSPNLRQPWS